MVKTIISFLVLVAVVAVGVGYSRGLSPIELYYSIANPYMRYVRIAEGWRKEQVADAFAKRLGWNEEDKSQFINVETETEKNLALDDGFYFPTDYLVPIDSSGTEVADEMIANFKKEIVKKYAEDPNNIRNLDTALTIASIIQREAAGKSDMKLISGIIWNRIFHGMPLQVDATVQYAKGTEENWWPRVSAKDLTTVESEYNTYLNEGLPPSPISNPGMAAIDAAFHPAKTSCLYYLHDRNRQIHCAATGTGHEANVKRYITGS